MRLLLDNPMLTAGAFPCLGDKLENPSKRWLLELLRILTLFILG